MQRHFQPGAAFVRELNGEALALEKLVEKPCEFHIVVDQQNSQQAASIREFSTTSQDSHVTLHTFTCCCQALYGVCAVGLPR